MAFEVGIIRAQYHHSMLPFWARYVTCQNQCDVFRLYWPSELSLYLLNIINADPFRAQTQIATEAKFHSITIVLVMT